MLVLVQGVKVQDVVLKELLENEHRVSVLAPVANGETLDLLSVRLSPLVKRIALVSLVRLLGVGPSQYDIVRECVLETSSLGELLSRLRDSVYDNVNIKLMCDLLLSYREGESLQALSRRDRTVIRMPLEEPFRTFLVLVVAYSLVETMSETVDEKALVLSMDRVDDVYDLLTPLRQYRTYILSQVQVRNTGIFDEIYCQTMSNRGIQLLKLVVDRVVSLRQEHAEISYVADGLSCSERSEIDLVQNEILTLLRELGFMNLQSLRDSVSQSLNVPKGQVDLAVAKLRGRGLIDVRFLPDGRVIVYPTILGLVKAAATGNNLRGFERDRGRRRQHLL